MFSLPVQLAAVCHKRINHNVDPTGHLKMGSDQQVMGKKHQVAKFETRGPQVTLEETSRHPQLRDFSLTHTFVKLQNSCACRGSFICVGRTLSMY